jgi:hypothetical protein
MLVVHTREGHRADLADLPPAKKARGNFATGIGDAGPMGRILIRGEAGHDIIAELYPIPGEPVVDKPGKGAFHATDLEKILANRGITQLLVCGVTKAYLFVGVVLVLRARYATVANKPAEVHHPHAMAGEDESLDSAPVGAV